MPQKLPRLLAEPLRLLVLPVILFVLCVSAVGQDKALSNEAKITTEQNMFRSSMQPLIKQYCIRCHNAEEMQSGIRLDQLDGSLEDRQLFLWKDILKQIRGGAMPPEDEKQLNAQQQQVLTQGIQQIMNAARSRDTQKNGAARRLTVSQYRNTLRDLLQLEDHLTDVLPPDGVSKDGFLNNGQTMLLSPLLVESYFDIAAKALDLCIVDEASRPVIQNFRVDLGKAINPEPCPDKLILGANSHLLANDNFLVRQLKPRKPFDYDPFMMRTKYRFVEGYQGNATVRGWREYDSIYHAVFACMRGNRGYPKGLPYQVIQDGLVLRPAIPSAELFQVESTYGPKANFKISLRELPEQGQFRVTVKAARYDDALLLNPGQASRPESTPGAITVKKPTTPQTVSIDKAGIYQADVYVTPPSLNAIPTNADRLTEALIGAWPLNGNTQSEPKREALTGRLQGGAQFVDSPFGKALSLDGHDDALVIDRDDSMNVGTGDFSVAAWIHPTQLRQGGIVCLGRYSWTHGWYFDMPNNKGILRIETVSPENKSNGTVASQPGAIRANTWQHVAAVVRRGSNKTKLFVNGYLVATGTIAPANLDNPSVKLHLGRIEGSKLFKGEIDDVRIYRRALDISEIKALLAPGPQFIKPPPPEKPQNLTLGIGHRQFSATLHQPAFAVLRLPAGPLPVQLQYDGKLTPDRVILTPLPAGDNLAKQFQVFEKRLPRLGVHMGLRRDCGSTFAPVGTSRPVTKSTLEKFVFEGALNNYPTPDVEENNVNYLAGIREIGVRSEYTDGRDMPRLLIRSVEFEGPYYRNWPPARHQNIFIDSKNKNQPTVYAREIIRSFASRAFRRPITSEEESSFLAVWKRSYDENADFQQSIKDALLIVLTSPQFLFIIENSNSPKPEELDPYELASKLSYFLWNTAPDQQLLKLAANNRLHKSLDSEVERMISNPQFEQFIDEFTSQWLSLDKFDVVEVDRKRFPQLTRDARIHLRQEPVEFLKYLIKNNLPLRNLVQSDFIIANEIVAGYYGLADRTEQGFKFIPIPHEDKQLGGILSQASILAGLSDGRESNPVKRGAWLARKIIAEPPDDPPPNVPALEGVDSKLPLRERLELHRNQKGCANCHAGIDPWGIPFEEFNAGGRWLEKPASDPSSTLPDGTEIEDFKALKAYLAGDRIDQVAFSFMKHLASYGNGRSLSYNELVFLEEKGVELRRDGYRMQDMIQFIIKSDMFLKK